MINENINVGIKLSGEYRFSILEDGKVVTTSDWRSNTILSGGLVDLYTYDVPTVMSNLDLGLSTSLSGSNGYGLSGVIAPSEFTNIFRDVNEIYQEDVSSKIYYSTFTTNRATTAVTLNEFAIKRGTNTTAFARNTFSTGYDIKVNQYINFEYRLTLNWDYTTTSNIAVTGNNSTYKYTVPSTTRNYNIPYDRVFYNNNYLALLGDIRDLDSTGNYNVTTRLPNMGENFPLYYNWGIQGDVTSIYTPTTILTSIDNTNKQFNVSTRYNNITCYPNSGVYSNIKNALLVVDGNFNSATSKFNITQFEYPLTVYNDAFAYIDGSTVINDTNKYNSLALTYNYCWYECKCNWSLCIDNTNHVLDNSWDVYFNDILIGTYTGDVYENICLDIDKNIIVQNGTNQIRFERVNCVSDDYFVFTLKNPSCSTEYSGELSSGTCPDDNPLPTQTFTFNLPYVDPTPVIESSELHLFSGGITWSGSVPIPIVEAGTPPYTIEVITVPNFPATVNLTNGVSPSYELTNVTNATASNIASLVYGPYPNTSITLRLRDANDLVSNTVTIETYLN
jgi:hypothetical protein